MANKKTPPAKKKTQPPAAEETKEATELTEQASNLSPTAETSPPDSPVETESTPEPDDAENVEDVEDPVANAISILSATNMSDAIESMSAVGMSDTVDSLSSDKPDSVRNAVKYLESYVASHPDIDEVVDRGTERAALIGFQSSKSGRDTGALETFLRRRWGLPVVTMSPGKHAWAEIKKFGTEPPPAGRLSNRQPAQRWVPKVPAITEEDETVVQHQGYNEAFEQARQEGYFGGPTAAGSIESGESRE